jgi:outer membrane protein OmpA-like peptidoglycan-associated protein
MKFERYLIAILMMVAASTLSSFAWQTTGVRGNESTGYHMKVVSRSTQSVDYRHKGSTKVDLKGTDLMPSVDGEAKVEGRPGGVKLDASLDYLQPANNLGLAYLTYVLWAITPEGQTHNLGEMVVKDGKSSLHTTTDLQAFALVLTAEPDFAVAEPSELVVAQNVVRPDTKGGVEPVDVTYELISRDVYNSQVQAVPQPMYGVDKSIPLDLLEARNAVRIAKDAGADQFASANLQKAQDSLNRAEDYYQRKQGSGPIGTVAREAVQAAEAARVMSIKSQEQEESARERQAAADREAQARADAEKQQQVAAQAQAQASQAQADAQAAQQAKAEADQARQQAETDKQQMRARLLQQLNQVLETKDTARGLIVNMPDVLFDTGKAELKSTARERLAKVAGILVAYPDIKVEIDGYTDSTGSLPFNERLSQQRADSVRSYLASQGVNNAALTTQGFGPDAPIASNDTAMGRQQNRRVELVVNGSSISDLVEPGSTPQQ